MEQIDIKKIFEENKAEILRNIYSVDKPTAYILGGQPAVGKSNLATIIKQQEKNILVVNGDDYRIYHPDFDILSKDPISFPMKTQEFSNTFTESLIKEAIDNKFNVSIEGTMRRPEIVKRTAEMFHNAGFKVEALCISAPIEYSEINSFSRYIDSVELRGTGRLADMNSLKDAFEGVPKTLDTLHQQGIVNKIRLFDIYAQKELKCYTLSSNGQYNDMITPPSFIVKQSRLNQLKTPSLINSHLSKAEQVVNKLNKFAPKLLSSFQPTLLKIISLANSTLSKTIDLEK